jgi:hypothetical protein
MVIFRQIGFGVLWFYQNVCVVAKDLFGQGGDTSDSYGAVGFVVGQRLMTSLPVYQGPPWNDEAVDFLIAHAMIRKGLHRGKRKAFIDQPGKITV